MDGVLRAAARLIGGVPKFGHIGEFMRDTLHWLPVRQRILYRVSTIAWRCIIGIAPAYLSELFVLSSSFSAAGHSILNGVVLELRSLPHDLSSSFYSLLKTFLFACGPGQ